MIQRLLSLAVLLLMPSAPAAAADWTSSLDPMKPGPHPKIRALEADYRLSWKGMIDAGKVTMSFDGLKGTARAWGGSQGMAARLFPYDFDYKGSFRPDALTPLRFVAWEKDKKDATTFTVNWRGDRAVSREDIRPHSVDAVFHRDHQFEFTPMFDLFTGMLHVRSQKLAVGETHRFVIFPQTGGYLVDTKVIGREAMHGKPAIRMELGMRKIGDDLNLQSYDKLKKATLWLADDSDRLLLELRAKVFIGDVRMSLTGARTK